jgi:polar amino acid transport system permease protein
VAVDIGFMLEVLPRLLPPLLVTVEISLISLVAAFVIGTGLGALAAALPRRHPLCVLLRGYVFFVRGTPAIVQIFAAYFLLPLAGLRLEPLWVGVMALTFNSAGYQIEIARAAIQSVEPGQHEAARALGLSNLQTWRLVVLPQALRRMLPPLTNELSQVVKASAILSVISVLELHKAANAIAAASFRFIEVLALQAILYFLVIQGLTLLSEHLERRLPGAPPGGGTGAAVR